MDPVFDGELRLVFAFIALVAAIFAAAAIILLKFLFARPRVPLRLAARIVLALAGAGSLCLLYGRFVEPTWIEVSRTRVVSKRIPTGHRGVRIVHLSDLHCDPVALVEERLPDIVAGLKPDLIVFTGDCVNSEGGIPVFQRCFTELARIAPTFAVRGNWDPRARYGVDVLGGLPIAEIDGGVSTIHVAGVNVHVSGLAFLSQPGRLSAALASVEADGPLIVLHHLPYPDIVEPSWSSRVDLMCAGHVHGGQVAMPLYGALITLSKFGKRFERGLYPDADGFGFPLYVSRGIGMEGGRAPRMRFCSRPEVALIELCPAP